MTAREQRLEAQVQWLAERLAVAVALEIRGEMIADREDVQELADKYRDAQDYVLDDRASWTVRREALKSTVEYERAKIRVREYLVKHLHGSKEKEAA